jgi:Ca-activated chloride channel homolog
MRRAFIFSLLIIGGQATAATLDTIRHNNRGASELESENAFQAERTFLNALADDPFNMMLRYNLGTAYLAQKKFDAAIKEYDAIIRHPTVPKELLFAAQFNAAVAAAENKNVDLALKYYQGALNLEPSSKEVKTNIELLTNSQGGGGGGGQSKNDNPRDQQGQDPGQDPKNGDKSKDKPEKAIGEKEMQDILEELGRQEQRIRALEYGNQKGTEKGPGKDW